MLVMLLPVAVQEAEPLGWYTAGEVGQLSGVSGYQVGQWARYGYMQSAWSTRFPRAYAYQDIAEAMVLHYLVANDVPYRSIRLAVREAEGRYGWRWPLSRARLFIIGEHFQSRGPRRTVVVDDLDVVARHPVLGQLDLIEVAEHLRNGGWAARQLGTLRHIEVDPNRHSGTPVIRGTRIPASDVAEMARTADGLTALRRDFALTREEIGDAVRWWDEVSQYQHVRLGKT